MNLIVLKILSLIELILALKDAMVDMPSDAYIGDSIEPTCYFDPENDTIYEIIWSKDNNEFYRVNFGAVPFKLSTDIPGIRIVLRKSDPIESNDTRNEESNTTSLRIDKNTVHLNGVDLDTAGIFRCEVSSEANVTLQTESQLEVIAIPSNGPKLSSNQTKYKINDTVTILCWYDSKPSAELKLFINNEKVNSDQTITTSSSQPNGYWRTSVTLSLPLIITDNQLDVQENCGRIRIKCIANVRNFSSTVSELILNEDDSDSNEEKSDGYSLSYAPIATIKYILVNLIYFYLF